MMVQETTVQETTEEGTTEEDTTQEESAEVVDREVVEEFFENEISTENEEAFELPPRQLTAEYSRRQTYGDCPKGHRSVPYIGSGIPPW